MFRPGRSSVVFALRCIIAFGVVCCRGMIYSQEPEDSPVDSLPAIFDFRAIRQTPFAPSFKALDDARDLQQQFPEFVPLDAAPSSSVVLPSLGKRAAGLGQVAILSPPQYYNLADVSYPLALLGRSETAIGTSADGSLIVVGWNDPSGFLSEYYDHGLTSYAYSLDGGSSFMPGEPLPVFMVDTIAIVPRGDPSIAITQDFPPTIYFANLAATRGITQSMGIAVARGTVGAAGITWNASSLISSVGFLDKEVIAADPRPGSQLVYCATTDYLGLFATALQIELYRSRDGGESWEGPIVISPPGNVDQEGVALTVGAGGEVYVAWERGKSGPQGQIMFSASTDQGTTFSAPQAIAHITPPSLHPPVGFNRAVGNDFPRLAVDASPTHWGRIYCVYQDAGTNALIHTDGVIVNTRSGLRSATGGVADGDIYIASSDDHGSTWSSPVLVSSDHPGDRKNQFWPVVSVDTGGAVNVIYYEDRELQPQPLDTAATSMSLGNNLRRLSSYQSLVDVIWRQSTDGGETFSLPVLLNETTSNWSISASNIVPNYGDYAALAAAGGSLYAAWAQAVSYDIDPGPAINNRYVPAVAFTTINGSQHPAVLERLQAATFDLEQNTPNPFNPVTRISFDLPARKSLTLKVYNAIGEEVATLMSGTYDAGRYTVQFSGANLPSGFYFYRLEAEELLSMKKMMLLK